METVFDKLIIRVYHESPSEMYQETHKELQTWNKNLLSEWLATNIFRKRPCDARITVPLVTQSLPATWRESLQRFMHTHSAAPHEQRHSWFFLSRICVTHHKSACHVRILIKSGMQSTAGTNTELNIVPLCPSTRMTYFAFCQLIALIMGKILLLVEAADRIEVITSQSLNILLLCQ